MEVTYTVEVVQDDIPVRGNALASGDDKADKECEDEILRRLDAGDVWAWGLVKVIAHFGPFIGKTYLGGCSYENEAGFRVGGYFEPMCQEAKDDLLSEMRLVEARGNHAHEILKALSP